MTTDPDRVWHVLEHDRPGTVESFDPGTVTDLPEQAQRFLLAAIPPGTPLATGVVLEMEGRIKLGRWLPFTARQILRAGSGFVWSAVVGGRLLRFVGADTLGPEGARMQFRFHGRITVVDATGPDVAHSAAGRLAAETVAWLPQALTPQAGATWLALSEDRATVTLPGSSGSIDAEVAIDDHGHVVDITLQRWKDSAKPPGFAPFGATISTTGIHDRVRIADTGEVGWDHRTANQESEAFFRYRLTSVRFLTEVGHI